MVVVPPDALRSDAVVPPKVAAVPPAAAFPSVDRVTVFDEQAVPAITAANDANHAERIPMVTLYLSEMQ